MSALKCAQFEICFETQCPYVKTDEKPDWYIHDILNNKTIIGMNSLDLWSGGQQLNRGYKYVCNQDERASKIVCVVCNKTVIKYNKNKIYTLFDTGFQNNTLCYACGLRRIIYEYFGLT